MARADDLYEQYLELGTLQKVGDIQDPPITRERVRQILKEAGYTKRNSHKIYTDEELKEHRQQYQHKKYWDNPEESQRKGRERQREYYKKNPEKYAEYYQNRVAKYGKEELAKKQTEWFNGDKEKNMAKLKAWRKANPDKVRQHSKTWRDKNPQKLGEQKLGEYNRKRRERYARDKAVSSDK